MILNEIRFLVGIHLGQKGLPPTIIAPTLNILNLLDTELEVMGFECSSQLDKEMERLKSAVVLMNYTEEEDPSEIEEEINKVLNDEPIEEDNDDNDDDIERILNDDD